MTSPSSQAAPGSFPVVKPLREIAAAYARFSAAGAGTCSASCRPSRKAPAKPIVFNALASSGSTILRKPRPDMSSTRPLKAVTLKSKAVLPALSARLPRVTVRPLSPVRT